MSQCFTCNSPEFTLDTTSGVMTCENGHQNYIGAPDHYSSTKEIDIPCKVDSMKGNTSPTNAIAGEVKKR